MKTGMKWAVGALLGALVVAPAPAFALPQQMNVQGLLTDASGGAVDGTFTVKLTLYPGKTGSGSVWTETKANVLVTTGLFDEIMGEDILNPLLPAIFAENAELWLGIQIMAGPGVPNGGEAELPRNKLATVAYAFEASHAAKADAAKTADLATTANLSKDVQCSGPCISAAEVGFNYAASATQGGDALNALMLNGKDYDTLVAEITAEASKNLKIDQSNMPPNGLNEVSNGQITNQFVDKVTHSYDGSIPAYTPGPPEAFNPLAIKDQNPQGTTDVIDFPDIGTAEKLTVSINITNSDLKTVKVTLTDPNFITYTLYNKGGTSDNKNLAVSYPDPTQTLSGDLTTWVGQNPKGKWVLTVVDSGFLNNKNDGQINAWSVGIQTLSSKKVEVTGDLIVDGKLTGVSGIAMQGDTTITGKLNVSGLATLSGGLSLGGGGTIGGLTSFADETTFKKLATFENGIDLKGVKPAVNLPDPTSKLDAANRHYVDQYSERSPNMKEAWYDKDENPYTVPAGKTFVITALSSYYTSYYMYILNPANNSYQYFYVSGGNGAWQHDWTRIYVPSGYKVYQQSGSNVAISGYLTADPEGAPVMSNTVNCGSGYTVPTGKTLVVTMTYGYYSSYYMYVTFPNGSNQYFYQRYNQGYSQMERTEIYIPAGSIVYGAGGCSGVSYQYQGWSGYLIPSLP